MPRGYAQLAVVIGGVARPVLDDEGLQGEGMLQSVPQRLAPRAAGAGRARPA